MCWLTLEMVFFYKAGCAVACLFIIIIIIMTQVFLSPDYVTVTEL